MTHLNSNISHKASNVEEAPAAGYPSKSIEAAQGNPYQNKASVEQGKIDELETSQPGHWG